MSPFRIFRLRWFTAKNTIAIDSMIMCASSFFFQSILKFPIALNLPANAFLFGVSLVTKHWQQRKKPKCHKFFKVFCSIFIFTLDFCCCFQILMAFNELYFNDDLVIVTVLFFFEIFGTNFHTILSMDEFFFFVYESFSISSH